MRPRLLPFALLLLAAAPARALPITGYAAGTIIQGHSEPPGSTARIFAVGSTFLVSFTYDLEPNPNLLIGIDIDGPGGFSLHIPPNPIAFGTRAEVRALEPGDWLQIDFAQGPLPIAVLLELDGEAGTLRYARDLGAPHEGFLATLVRAEAPVPEPSGMVLGLMGVALAVSWRWGAGR